MSVREKQSIIGTLNADKKQSIVGNIGIADVLIREGEYYIPNVSQIDENTILLSLTPSKDFMESVPDQEIELPRGTDGKDYVLTEDDKRVIAEQAASFIVEPAEYEAIELATMLGLVSPAAAEDGSIYTDENGALYSL